MKVMELSRQVYRYYVDNLDRLDDGKRLHFASRVAAWSGDRQMLEVLRTLRDYVLQPERKMTDVFDNLLADPVTAKHNTNAMRQSFLGKYPRLYGTNRALFRANRLERIYGIDARSALLRSVPKLELLRLKRNLLSDRPAIKSLSTYAINYCYLLELTILKKDNSLPLELFYEIGDDYDLDDADELRLMIYMYTHCIIGDTNFYTRDVPTANMPIYHQMLVKLESTINNHYDRISLDNKLEFLVCARICGFATDLFDRIYGECEKSLSPDGIFLIDRHNQRACTGKNGLAQSEHRNVLFIMSTSDYTPHSALVG